MNIFLSQLQPALKSCWKNKKLIVLSSIIDFVFFVVLVFIHYEFFRRLKDHLLVLVAEMQKASLDLLMQENLQDLNAELLKSSKFVSAYHEMLKYVAVFFLAVFIAWLVFKSINWYLANVIVRKRVFFRKYLKHFFLYSVLWFFGVIAVLLLSTYLMSYSATNFLPLFGQKAVYCIALFLFAVLAYFAFISFSLIPSIRFRDVFRIGVLRCGEIVPAHLILILVAVLAVYIPFRLALLGSNTAYWIALFFVLLVSIPAFSYGRIYISLVIQGVCKKWIKKS